MLPLSLKKGFSRNPRSPLIGILHHGIAVLFVTAITYGGTALLQKYSLFVANTTTLLLVLLTYLPASIFVHVIYMQCKIHSTKRHWEPVRKFLEQFDSIFILAMLATISSGTLAEESYFRALFEISILMAFCIAVILMISLLNRVFSGYSFSQKK